MFVQSLGAAGFNTFKFFSLEKLNPHYKQDVGKSDSDFVTLRLLPHLLHNRGI